VDAAYYARIERGQVDLRLSTMVRVTKALEVSMEELLGC
jgi:predicted transcriptional regulator